MRFFTVSEKSRPKSCGLDFSGIIVISQNETKRLWRRETQQQAKFLLLLYIKRRGWYTVFHLKRGINNERACFDFFVGGEWVL
jgi:hypothetical protein